MISYLLQFLMLLLFFSLFLCFAGACTLIASRKGNAGINVFWNLACQICLLAGDKMLGKIALLSFSFQGYYWEGWCHSLFRIFSLSLVLWNFTMMCFGLGFYFFSVVQGIHGISNGFTSFTLGNFHKYIHTHHTHIYIYQNSIIPSIGFLSLESPLVTC